MKSSPKFRISHRVWLALTLACSLVIPIRAAPVFAQSPTKGKAGKGGNLDGPSDPLFPLTNKLADQQSQIKDLRKKSEIAESKNRRLRQEIESLNANIQKLQKVLPELKRWQQASFVLGDSRATDAVAVLIENDRYSIIGKASGPDVADRVAAATKAKVTRVATETGRNLARRIVNAPEFGEELPSEFATEIRNKIWVPRRIIPGLLNKDGTPIDPEFVVFRAVRTARQQIGIIKDADQNSLTYYPVGFSEKTIERTQIEPGSLRADLGADILDAVDGDETYLDYCILGIANKLNAIGNENGHMAVGIHVGLDGIRGGLDDARRETNEFFELNLQNIPFFYGSSIGGAVRKDLSRVIPDPNALLKQKAREIEDIIYMRMRNRDVPIVEGEYVDAIRAAQEKLNSSEQKKLNPSEVGSLLNASHIVVADLDTLGRDRIRLSMRLVDVKTGGSLWASNSELTCPKQRSDNAVFLKSGTLALMSLEPTGVASKNVELKGYELPLKVAFAHKLTAAKLPTQQLVIVEPSGNKDLIAYRPLFDRDIQTVRKPAVIVQEFPRGFSEFLGMANKETNANLSEHLVRAVVWELAAKGLTPAGRVEEVLENRESFRLSIGKENGLKPDSFVRVFRPKSESKENEGMTDFPLPMSLKVRSVDNSTSIAVPIRNGLRGLWEEDNLWPRVGDIVYDPNEKPRKVAIFPPQSRAHTLSPKDIYAMSGGKDHVWLDIRKKENALAKKIQSKLRDGFLKLNSVAYESEGIFNERDELNVPETCAAAAKDGSTHAIGGYIQPVKVGSQIKYDVSIIVFELLFNGETWRTQDLLSIPIGRLTEKSWD